MSRASAILEQYRKEEKKTGNVSKNNTYNVNNYFNIMLPNGVDSLSKTIRIVPFKDETISPFQVVHVHSYKVDGKFQKFICPKHMDDEDCPMCETRNDLHKIGTDDAKETAKKFNTKEMYVVKIIDRSDEAHGIKFFRFGKSYNKQGIFDKIADLVESYLESGVDIIDPVNGMDLELKINRSNKGYPTVTSIIPKPSSKLHEDDEKIEEYLNDESTWRDRFGVKSYEYLNIITQNKIPVFNKELKKFVAKDDGQSTYNGSNEYSNEDIIKGKHKEENNETSSNYHESSNEHDDNDNYEDDLPF